MKWMPTDRELIEAQAEALYTHDAEGCLVCTNEPQPHPASRFFLGRTRGGNVWRVHQDLPRKLAHALTKWAALEPAPTDLREPPVHFEQYRDLLSAHGEIRQIYAGPAYHFPEDVLVTEHVVRITPANAVLVARGFGLAAGRLDGWHPWFAVVEEGMAVSICFSSRITPRVAEAGVETLAPYRGRGYATRAVAAWARAVRERGRIPLYSTSWENTASQAVARKLGMIMYGADFSIR